MLNETNDPFREKLIVSKVEEDESEDKHEDKHEDKREDKHLITNENDFKKTPLTQSESLSNGKAEIDTVDKDKMKDEIKEFTDIDDYSTRDTTNSDNITNETKRELEEVIIPVPDEINGVNNHLTDDIKDQKKELYYKAKSKAIEARLNALKMIAEANNLKNILLLDNEIINQNNDDDDFSLGDLDELSDSQSEFSVNDDSHNSDFYNNTKNLDDSSNEDNIQLEFEELSNISKNNDIDELQNRNNIILKEEGTDDYDSDSSDSSSLESETEKITIHY